MTQTELLQPGHLEKRWTVLCLSSFTDKRNDWQQEMPNAP